MASTWVPARPLLLHELARIMTKFYSWVFCVNIGTRISFASAHDCSPRVMLTYVSGCTI